MSVYTQPQSHNRDAALAAASLPPKPGAEWQAQKGGFKVTSGDRVNAYIFD